MGAPSTAPAVFERHLGIPDACAQLLELGQQFNVPTPGQSSNDPLDDCRIGLGLGEGPHVEQVGPGKPRMPGSAVRRFTAKRSTTLASHPSRSWRAYAISRFGNRQGSEGPGRTPRTSGFGPGAVVFVRPLLKFRKPAFRHTGSQLKRSRPAVRSGRAGPPPNAEATVA